MSRFVGEDTKDPGLASCHAETAQQHTWALTARAGSLQGKLQEKLARDFFQRACIINNVPY